MLHKSGMQTWEYSPVYALRTFAFLYPMYGVGVGLKLLTGNKVVQFLLLKSIVAGLLSGVGELALGRAMVRSKWLFLDGHCDEMKKERVGFLFLLFSMVSPGMFHASGAFLPSTFAMFCVTWSTIFLLDIDVPTIEVSSNNDDENDDNLSSTSSVSSIAMCKEMKHAIFVGLVATLALGWPFCAVCWIPCGLYAIYDAFFVNMIEGGTSCGPLSTVVKLLQRTAQHAIFIQAIVTFIDYAYYGKVTFPSINIFLYNTSNGGDELYGVEPTSFYLKNILLNFNVVGVFALVFPLAWLMQLHKRSVKSNELLFVTLVAPLVLWFCIIVPRPHKEERFVFPVYPLICAGGAVGLEMCLQYIKSILEAVSRSKKASEGILKLSRGFIVITCCFMSVARIAALHKYYAAPLSLYTTLHDKISHSSSNATVCVGGDWHRYPSSFFLPPGSHLAFLPSNFKGQLPQPFPPGGVAVDPIEPFNNLNKEEKSRYIEGGVSSCAFVVELVFDRLGTSPPTTILQMQEDKGGKWDMVNEFDFLDAERTGGLHRLLFIPYISKRRVVMGKYALFERKRVSK